MTDEPYKLLVCGDKKTELKVSLEDYDDLSKYNWWYNTKTRDVSRYYKYINKKRTRISLRRYLMNVHGKKGVAITHANGDNLDYRRTNLILTNNMLYEGIHFDNKTYTWSVKIIHHTGSKHINFLKNEDTAIFIYNLMRVDCDRDDLIISLDDIIKITNNEPDERHHNYEPYRELYIKNKKVYTKLSLDDYCKFEKYTWHINGSGYIEYTKRVSKTFAKYYKIHRCILDLKDPSIFVDHINGDPLDNRKSNLRICNYLQNSHNCKVNKLGYSKFKGVYLTTDHNFWQVLIQSNHKRRGLTGIKNEVIAALIYDILAIEEHNEFAYLNFPVSIKQVYEILTKKRMMR